MIVSAFWMGISHVTILGYSSTCCVGVLSSLEIDISDIPLDDDVKKGVIKFRLRTITMREMCEHYKMKNEGEHTCFSEFCEDMDRFWKIIGICSPSNYIEID
ncbi:hypothetical protein Droror1_Dr00025101 [Drosera rotundifolia]